MMAEDDLTPAEIQEAMQYMKQLESGGIGAGYPVQEQDKSLTGFFREIAGKLKKTFRVANHNEEELERVRSYLDTAHYAYEMGLKKVGLFLEEEALIISDTSLGRGGFLIKAAITTKKETTARLGEEKKKKSGWSLFGKKKQEEDELNG